MDILKNPVFYLLCVAAFAANAYIQLMDERPFFAVINILLMVWAGKKWNDQRKKK